MILPTALIIDLFVGDPGKLPHPIRWMGVAIERYEPIIRRRIKNEIRSGALFAVSLIVACWSISSLLMCAARWYNPMAGMVTEVVMLFFCLSARSLYDAGMEIYHLLWKGQVDSARTKLSFIVGRDVQHYQADDIARATVETVAENFVDGVLSPLFFAAIGGAPLAMTYKMVNTLDSMVGYKNERYIRFGRIAARIDDVANYVPARLSVAAITIAAGVLSIKKGWLAMATAAKEGHRHSSPNAGYPEAAFAGALAVKLNGPNHYGGRLVDKPYIGAGFGPAGLTHLRMACELMLVATMLSGFFAWGGAVMWW